MYLMLVILHTCEYPKYQKYLEVPILQTFVPSYLKKVPMRTFDQDVPRYNILHVQLNWLYSLLRYIPVTEVNKNYSNIMENLTPRCVNNPFIIWILTSSLSFRLTCVCLNALVICKNSEHLNSIVHSFPVIFSPLLQITSL